MRLVLSTNVEASAEEVWNGFDKKLFIDLAPPFPLVKLLKFEGSTTGDNVGIELNFILFKQKWESLITDHGENGQEIYFVDEGVRLPFFLSTWKHKHRIIKKQGSATITDEISFSAGNILFDLLLYPGLYLQFLYRKPIYKRVFKKR